MTAEQTAVPEEDRLRADLYDLLGVLLSRPPTDDLLARLRALDGDDSDLGRAIRALATVAEDSTERSVEREYNALFIGLGRGELLPYASFYLTGFLNEKPLATLRGDMARLGIARTKDVSEPEDHIAGLSETMAGLIRGTWDAPLPLSEQYRFFKTHLSPWAGHFFADLEGAKGSRFYAPVGTIGRIFVDIETEAFRMEDT